ncbi:hypothetical protein PP657_gp103 [Bacillus phage BCPST]|uniref:Uncharacterized protein n=1 Tax=Bacillus phage BCPST TaxID=2801506 RepID=A0AAE7P4V5_9CAUD|nr:hypothetical protein PP657_gp103 [Bacillus phage BCPST]QQO38719.1 hypothetical protein BCPST_101 [Bacillus phage BCPST]QSJ04308.1 hypothetical protein BCP6_104 [Bacillus phage BCP6]
MIRKEQGYVLMTSCGRLLSEKNGIYSFATDPFEAKFFEDRSEACESLKKAWEMWGETLFVVPSERTINLLG